MKRIIVCWIYLGFWLLMQHQILQAQDAPDYTQLEYWAAHPDKEDPADMLPDEALFDNQKTSNVDVFFLHPTTYTKGKPKQHWNGSVKDLDLRMKTDSGTILHQASIFNGAGRVFAPYYRQAHLHSYFTKDKARAKAAFDLAYQDVKAAFTNYLKVNNQNRPIIIAAHSQGTNHATALLKDFFEQDPKLKERLVVAYLVGMPIEKNTFSSIPVCESAEQTNCFCSWRTFKEEHLPKKHALGDSIAVTNPISWTTSKEKVEKSRNKGSVLRKFENGFIPHLVGTQVKDGVLWVNKPKFPGSFLLINKNYHIADYNLFYLNVRENSIARVKSYNQKLQ